MVTITLNGGIGNQLFQIATAYAHAKNNDDECAFDFTPVTVNQGNNPSFYRDNIFKKLKELPYDWKPSMVYQERGYDFQHLPYQKDMCLKGYFQRDQYFKEYREELITLFLNEDVVDNVLGCFHSLLHNSLSLHVRHGDYVSKFSHIYHTLPKEYYDKSIMVADELMLIENILIFSDDIPWCREVFTDKRMIFITGKKDYKDLLLMGFCNANIIANSSFSWWGAWLGETDNKLVIAPSKWFLNKSNEEIIPSRWITI